jgi:hypothetical protein
VDNVEMGLSKRVSGGTDWINLTQIRDGWKAVVNKIRKLRIP